MAGLFTPLSLREVTFRNRVWLSPMCQYSVAARDGIPHDWHLMHLGARAAGGFGLVLTEATAVAAEGRISLQDTGIWNDEQAAAWERIISFIHAQDACLGVQLAHAGRKSGTFPWLPGAPNGTVPPEEGGWVPLGPSPLPMTALATPREMTTDDVAEVVSAFAAAARRCDEAGADVVEIHAAHGYLLHQFLSPLANQRTDRYGGSFENRTRLLLEVTAAVRASWPEQKPLFVRLSATDWRDEDESWDLEQCVEVCRLLRDSGVDLIDVSSGGVASARIPQHAGYQVPFASAIRSGADIPTAAVGLITTSEQAQRIVAEEEADAVLIGRAALREPAWPQRAAYELGVQPGQAMWVPPYSRGAWELAPDPG